MTDAISLMWRDLGEAPFLAVVLVLPTVISIRPVLRGSLLGWVAPVILVAQLVAWFSYYATDAPNVGLGVGLGVALVPWALGAMASVAAWFTTRRRSLVHA